MSETLTSHNQAYDGEIEDPDAVLVPVSASEAAARLASEAGRSPEVAQAMVRAYLDDVSAQVGVPVHLWGLDDAGVAEARRRFEWIDFEQGETIATARARAAREAAAWTQAAATVDRDHEPGYASRIDQEIRYWTERARDPHNHQDGDEDAEPGDGARHTSRDPLDAARQACTVLPAHTRVAAALDDDGPSEAGHREGDSAAAVAVEAAGR
jgi:hypothetical protein